MDLSWNGARLTGTLNPGINAIPITTGYFATDSGFLKMEANGIAGDGKMVHYTMEGRLTDGVITGTWLDGDEKNDFQLRKS